MTSISALRGAMETHLAYVLRYSNDLSGEGIS